MRRQPKFILQRGAGMVLVSIILLAFMILTICAMLSLEYHGNFQVIRKQYHKVLARTGYRVAALRAQQKFQAYIPNISFVLQQALNNKPGGELNPAALRMLQTPQQPPFTVPEMNYALPQLVYTIDNIQMNGPDPANADEQGRQKLRELRDYLKRVRATVYVDSSCNAILPVSHQLVNLPSDPKMSDWVYFITSDATVVSEELFVPPDNLPGNSAGVDWAQMAGIDNHGQNPPPQPPPDDSRCFQNNSLFVQYIDPDGARAPGQCGSDSHWAVTNERPITYPYRDQNGPNSFEYYPCQCLSAAPGATPGPAQQNGKYPYNKVFRDGRPVWAFDTEISPSGIPAPGLLEPVALGGPLLNRQRARYSGKITWTWYVRFAKADDPGTPPPGGPVVNYDGVEINNQCASYVQQTAEGQTYAMIGCPDGSVMTGPPVGGTENGGNPGNANILFHQYTSTGIPWNGGQGTANNHMVLLAATNANWQRVLGINSPDSRNRFLSTGALLTPTAPGGGPDFSSPYRPVYPPGTEPQIFKTQIKIERPVFLEPKYRQVNS